jgi:2,4-dienoyl-CoA reductase-like NADH-dependent reductase (Old Yellow Enzyme family)
MTSLFDPLDLGRGHMMRNRFMMGPLTNIQSPDNGHMSDEEYRWLEMRTHGGYGLMSTCTAMIGPDCAALEGQIGVWLDSHMPQLRRVAKAMKAGGSIAIMQINHSGLRADPSITGQPPYGPYAEPEFGGLEMSTADIHRVIADFAAAAKRAQECGFDGVEVHGAHTQLLAQFLNPENLRTDGYGGPTLEARSRALVETLRAIRDACGETFLLSVRLSTERYEINLGDFLKLSQLLIDSGLIDILDMSLWDCFKQPDDPAFAGKRLIEWALGVNKRDVKIAIAGKIRSGPQAQAALDAGADIVVMGRAAILHDDFPKQVAADPEFAMTPLPVTEDYLRSKAVSNRFVGYLRLWDGFVANSGRGLYTEMGTMVAGDLDPG